MTPKIQLIKGLAALIDSLDSTPKPVVTKPIADEYKVPRCNTQNSTIIQEIEAIQSLYRKDHLRDMFSLKPLGEIKSNFKDPTLYS